MLNVCHPPQFQGEAALYIGQIWVKEKGEAVLEDYVCSVM